MAQGEGEIRQPVWLTIALLIALALTVWRGAEAFSHQAPSASVAGASDVEQRLTGLLETVVGPGALQVHRAERPDGSQAVLVLMNVAETVADPGDEAITRLLASATFFDPLAGDTLTVERFAFAAEAPGLPAPAMLIELFALVSVCGLILMGMVRNGARVGPRAVQADAKTPYTEHAAARATDAPRMDGGLVAQTISEDPRSAAMVIRKWLRSGVSPR